MRTAVASTGTPLEREVRVQAGTPAPDAPGSTLFTVLVDAVARAPVLLALAALWGCNPAGEETATPGPRDSQTRVQDASVAGFNPVLVEDEGLTGRKVFPVSLQEAWIELQNVWVDLDLPASAIEWEQGRIVNDGVRVRRIDGERLSRFFSCGQGLTGPNADRLEVTVTLETRVQPAPGGEGGTLFTVQTGATARDRATTASALACRSTGVLEQRIINRLALRLVRGEA